MRKTRSSSKDSLIETRSSKKAKLKKDNDSSSDQVFSDLESSEIEQFSSSDGFVEKEEIVQDVGSITYVPAQRILTHRDSEYSGNEYFVKFQNMSYRKCDWVHESYLKLTQSGNNLLNKYTKLYSKNPPEEPYFDQKYLEVDKIVGHSEKKGKISYLIKWKSLDYEFNTWESSEDIKDPKIITAYNKSCKPPSKKILEIPPKPSASNWRPLSSLGKSKSGLSPRSYQIEGVNFLMNSWYHNRNAILADEMGLGKTVQTILFLRQLFSGEKIRGPYLVIAPLSTIGHWNREAQEWTEMSTIVFHGKKEMREQMIEYEFFYPETNITKFQLLITTYEYINKEHSLLSNIEWRCLVVDEAHRLKNSESKLIESLKNFHSDFRLLLTGTPLQNNIQELWSLLNFLDETKFNSSQSFLDKFGDLNETAQITELQSVLKPLMLRRLKGDVEKGIAPLEEIIIECGMTQHQRSYYQSIYKKNLAYLTRGAHKFNTTNLHNVSMELRKVCNHPYLITGSEEQILIERAEMTGGRGDSSFEMESLIRSSGKLILLDKLLSKLYADNHRVLIFSQMTRMLDILQDYLFYRKYSFERLDGSIRGDLRQDSIDRFNAPSSNIFVFLLCTRAGGQGINLTSADTVIIYDSDWNPQNDIQATARCHRIGQKKEVKAYRLITANSYEQKLFNSASLKLGLDHAVLESSKMDPKGEEVEKLLRLGAYYAFEDDGTEGQKINEEEIDSILSKSTRINHSNVVSGDGSTFSKATFEVTENKDQIDVSAPDFWKKYVPDVIEDKFDSGISIAERVSQRKIDRKTSSTANGDDSRSSTDEDELDAIPSSSDESEEEKSHEARAFWSKSKVKVLMVNLWRYGWGRWNSMNFKSSFTCSHSEIRSVARIILKWILEASSEDFPIVSSIIEKAEDVQMVEFETTFEKKSKDQFFEMVTNGSKWKLERIELMYFVNQIVSTCPNPPTEIIVPFLPSKPTTWWTDNDDRVLMYFTYTNGFHQYQEMQFSNDQERPSSKLLGNRLRSMINNLRHIFMKYQEHRGSNVHFDHETLKTAQMVWSKKLHQRVVSVLTNHGYESSEKVKELLETDKDIGTIETYVNEVLRIANIVNQTKKETTEKTEDNTGKSDDTDDKSEPKSDDKPTQDTIPELPNIGILAEPITVGQASRILNRVNLFAKARDILKNKALPEKDESFLRYVCTNGLFKITESDLMKEIFGNESLEKKVVHKMKVLSNSKRTDRSSSSSQSISARIKRDENGKPCFPIVNGPSLTIINIGTVVSDRENFHTARYVYPSGYIVERQFISIEDPNERDWYRASIVDRGGQSPVFRVEYIKDPSKCFEGSTPSAPWLDLVRAVETKKKELGIPTVAKSLSLSGPEYFGLASQIVQQLMQEMDGIEKCIKFQKPPGEVVESKVKPVKSKKNIDNSSASEAEIPENTTKSQKSRKKKPIFDFPGILKRAREQAAQV